MTVIEIMTYRTHNLRVLSEDGGGGKRKWIVEMKKRFKMGRGEGRQGWRG